MSASPVLITEDVGLEHPQDAVGAVEGEIDPPSGCATGQVGNEREGREDGRTLVRVDEVLLFHGDLGSATDPANVDFLDGAVIGLVDRQHEAARVDLLPRLGDSAGDGEDVARDGLEVRPGRTARQSPRVLTLCMTECEPLALADSANAGALRVRLVLDVATISSRRSSTVMMPTEPPYSSTATAIRRRARRRSRASGRRAWSRGQEGRAISRRDVSIQLGHQVLVKDHAGDVIDALTVDRSGSDRS